MPAILLALAISGAVIVAAELLRALDLTAGVRFVIEGLNVAAIAFALAACAATICDHRRDRPRARDRERLDREPARAARGHQAITDDIGGLGEASPDQD